MNRIRYDRSVFLLLIFLLLQLGGQTAAGFAGRAGGINLYTITSYACLFLRGLVWIMVLKRLPLTVAYPFTGAVYLLILPLSMIVFDETPGWSRFAGAALIFIGIIFSASGAVKSED